MAFSYTIFLALLLLAPGFALWAGLRLSERRDVLSPAPDKPGSTTTLLIVVLGALVGHLALAIAYAAQAAWCAKTGICAETGFDPNVYRALFGNMRGSVPSDAAIAVWFASLLVPAVLVGLAANRLARLESFGRIFGPPTLGWLYPMVQEARRKDSFILAYAVTTLEHEGASVGYQGIVERISLDDDEAIAMLVLTTCDRFLVKITEDDAVRVTTKHKPIPLIHLRADQIANVVLEVFPNRPATPL